jgi:hypothetical protein
VTPKGFVEKVCATCGEEGRRRRRRRRISLCVLPVSFPRLSLSPSVCVRRVLCVLTVFSGFLFVFLSLSLSLPLVVIISSSGGDQLRRRRRRRRRRKV